MKWLLILIAFSVLVGWLNRPRYIGTISGVKVWNEVKTQEEINDMYLGVNQ